MRVVDMKLEKGQRERILGFWTIAKISALTPVNWEIWEDLEQEIGLGSLINRITMDHTSITN